MHMPKEKKTDIFFTTFMFHVIITFYMFTFKKKKVTYNNKTYKIPAVL